MGPISSHAVVTGVGIGKMAHAGAVGLITRRSAVQICPPLLSSSNEQSSNENTDVETSSSAAGADDPGCGCGSRQAHTDEPVSGNGRSRSRLRDYQRRWIADRRAAFLAGKSCVECGSVDALELDHVDKASKVDHRIWSWSDDRRSAELAKCRVVCKPCHVERHAAERRSPLIHGTRNAYKKKLCRCDVCRHWNAEYQAGLKRDRAVAA